MNDGVLEFVFLLIVENDALVVDKVEDTDSPDGAAQELDHEVIHPFLGKGKVTSSASSSLGDFLGFCYLGYYFFFPKSHSSISFNLGKCFII